MLGYEGFPRVTVYGVGKRTIPIPTDRYLSYMWNCNHKMYRTEPNFRLQVPCILNLYNTPKCQTCNLDQAGKWSIYLEIYLQNV